MKKQLAKLYLNPTSNGYRLFDYQNRYFIRLLFTLSLLIIAYPIGLYGYFYYQTEKETKQTEQLDQTLNQKAKLLAGLMQFQTEQSRKDSQLAALNQAIKHIIETHSGEIENIQWQFHSGKQIYLSVNQSTPHILKIIDEINQLPLLQFKEMTLLKLNEKRFIQLNAQLLVNNQEKK